MAWWLDGDRIVTPHWFTSAVTGSWSAASGTPALSGRIGTTNAAVPSGYSSPPSTSGDITCRWGGSRTRTMTATSALVSQLGLPTTVVGRQIRLRTTSAVVAYVPGWLFPPAT